MSTRILKIGRTNYYSVKKGQQQYCIVEGRRVQDLDHCWQVLRDPDSGRNFFVNRAGVRRWHLPDIYQTERERAEEEKALRFRRQQKQEELKRLQRSAQSGQGGTAGANRDEVKEEGQGQEEEEVSEALRGVVNQKELFAARDAAARQLVLLPGWETPAARKPVTRLAKAILTPYYLQGTITEEALSALVTTGVREFCAKHDRFGPSERETLTKDLKDLVQTRVDEDARRGEFQRMNEDLLDRLKRVDEERKELATKLAENVKAEEEMRQELFRLRAHKQDVLLHSFKRLTRAGLVQAYWERWTRYKAIVEAQNHVNARERRTREMSDRIKDLETTLKESEAEAEELRFAEQKRRAKEVIERILGQLGRDVQQRFFVKWVKFALERKQERDLFRMRQEMENCPRCSQRNVDMDRVSAHVLEAWQATHTLQRKLAEKSEECDRNYVVAMYWRSFADFNTFVLSDARHIANTQFASRSSRDELLKSQERRIRELVREVDGLRFEISFFGGGGGGAAGAMAEFISSSKHDDDNAGREGERGGGRNLLITRRGSADAAGTLQSQRLAAMMAATGGGNMPRAPHEGTTGGSSQGGAANDQQLTSFFLSDASMAESRLVKKLTTLPDAGAPPANLFAGASNGNNNSGLRGIVQPVTQSAIAPSVFKPVAATNSSENLGYHSHGQQIGEIKPRRGAGELFGGGDNSHARGALGSSSFNKYYDPIVGHASPAHNILGDARGEEGGVRGGAQEFSAFDQRTREIADREQRVLEKEQQLLLHDGHIHRGEGGDDGSRSYSSSSSSSDSLNSSSSSTASSSQGIKSSPSSSSSFSEEQHKSKRAKRKRKNEARLKNVEAGGDHQLAAGGDGNRPTTPGGAATTVQTPNAKDSLSRYLAEKEARKSQASVLQFIKPPITSEEVQAMRYKALAEALESAEEKEAKRCPKCGFRFDSAAFCPRDGTRHTFKPLELKHIPVEVDRGSVLQQQQQQQRERGDPQYSYTEGVRGGRGGVVPAGPSMSMLQTHRDDPMRALVLPEHHASVANKLMSNDPNEAPRHLKLPPGMVPVKDNGTVPDAGPLPPPPHPLVQKHTSLLRNSLNLDPRAFHQPKLYTISKGGGQPGEDSSFIPLEPQHPRDVAGAKMAMEQEALYRDTVDAVRSTRIMTEVTRRITERRAGPKSVAAEEKRRSYAERSIVAGYNPSADPDSALSLDSRLFTGTRQTQGMDTDSLDVPNYFSAKSAGFASRAGAFQSSMSVTPSLVSEKLSTHASERYSDLRGNNSNTNTTNNNNNNNNNIYDTAALQNKNHNTNNNNGIATTISRGAVDSAATYAPRSYGQQQQQHAYPASGGGVVTQSSGGVAAQQRSSWSNVFQFNDVLKGLGLNVGDSTTEVFGAIRETRAAKPTNAQLLASQMQSAPNFGHAGY